jgi:hypothetical protein
MNRLIKYRESIDRFIKNTGCIYNNIEKSTADSLFKTTENNNRILSIMLLTIMNNRNKKQKITIQGYYAAVSIEYINILLCLINEKHKYETLYGKSNYNKYIIHLLWCINKSICSNMDSIKLHINNCPNTFIQIMEIYNKFVSPEYLLCETNFVITTEKINNDVLKWYIKDNKDLEKKYNNFFKISEDSFMEYIQTKIKSICNITFCTGWLLGCGDNSNILLVDKMSNHFSMIYKLYIDFINLEENILNSDKYCVNFVANYGLHYSYDLFMKHKKKFLEICMTLDTFTATIKEIIYYIEFQVEQIIDQTSPDLKSNMSNITGYT